MRQVWLPAILLAVALRCSLAAAQSGAQTGEYRALTDSAVEEHALGHYSEARSLFAKAHALYPNARTLWGMGVASFEERLYVDAIRMLKQALVHPVKPLTAAQHKEAESLIERSAAFVVRVRIDLSPENAHLTVDGSEIERSAQGELELDTGAHQLVATAPGYAELTRAVRWAVGGEQPALEMHLVPLAGESRGRTPEAHAPAAGARASTAPTEDAARPKRSLNALKWVSLGATVASMAVLATGFGLRQTAAKAYNDDQKCPTPKKETCTTLRGTVHRRELVAITGAAATGVFAVITIVAFVLAAKDAKRASQAAATCAPSIAPGIACSVRF